MKKIFCRHLPFSEEQQQLLTGMAAEAGYTMQWLPTDFQEDISDAEVLLGYFPVDRVKEMQHLRWVQLPCAGAEAFCEDIYAREDVVLTNGSGAFGVVIAEYLLTGILMLLRNMETYRRQQGAHQWKSAGLPRTICGSTVTVVGMGDLGTCFAERVKALGATVRGVRRSMTEGPACYDRVYPVSDLREAVAGADVVALCLPATQETRNLITEDILTAMKPGAILCNCGRGKTVDEEALITVLRQGKLGGAVLDVFQTEPLPEDSPLWDMPNVIVTPHVSGQNSAPSSAAFLFSLFQDNLGRYLRGEPLRNVVDRKRGY